MKIRVTVKNINYHRVISQTLQRIVSEISPSCDLALIFLIVVKCNVVCIREIQSSENSHNAV